MKVCINYNDPAWSALVEGLRDKLGINAEWEAKRDFYEHGGIIRTPKEVLAKLAADTTFGPYAHHLEDSVEGNKADELFDKIVEDIKQDATSYKPDSTLHRVTIPFSSEGKIKTKKAAEATADRRVKELQEKYKDISTNLFSVDKSVAAGAAIVVNITDAAVVNYMKQRVDIAYNIEPPVGYVTEINTNFNNNIKKFILGKQRGKQYLPEGYVFKLGKPTRILKASGFKDVEITLPLNHLEDIISKHSKLNAMDDLDLIDLPSAIHNPMIVLYDKDYAGTGRLMIVTTLQNSKNQNINVFIQAVPGKSRNFDVNSVVTLFPRASVEGLDKEILKGSTIFVNKEKTLEYYRTRTTPGSSSDISKGNTNIRQIEQIIKEFNNPTSEDPIYNQVSENQDPSVSPLALELSGFDGTLNIADQNEARAQEITRKLADRLADQVNTPYRIVSLQEAKDIHAQLGKELPAGAKAFYIGDTVYFLQDNLNTKNVLHEFSHPLVRAVYVSNRPLFDKQFSAIMSSAEGADIADYVRNNYGLDENDPLFKEEIVVRALTEAALRKQQERPQSTGFKKAIDNILYAIKQLLRKLFGQKVDVAKLDVDTTLDQLADMLVKGDQFKIDTEMVTQDDAVAYLKDQQKYIQELSQSAYKKDLQELTDKYFTTIQYAIKHAKDIKNYDAMLDFISNDFKSGEVDQMRKNIEKYQTLILDKTSQKLGTIQFDKERVNALIDSLTSLHNLTGKIFSQLQDLTKDLSQDNMQKIEYYKNVLNHWGEFIEEAEDNLTSKIPADSSLGKLLGDIRHNINSSNNLLNRTYEGVALDTLWSSVELTARAMQETFDSRMKALEDKLAKATPAARESVQKQIEKEKAEFAEQLPTKEKVRQALRGELKDSKGQIKDAPFLTSFVEAYVYNPDPVVGGLANFFKDNMTDMQAKAYNQANEFGNAMKPLLEKIGYQPNSEGKLGRDIGQEEEVGEVDKDGNFIKKKVWRFLNPIIGADVVRQEYTYKIRKARDKFLETNAEEDKIALRDIQAEWRQHKRDFWHDKYTDQYNDVWNLLERDEVGKELAGMIEDIYDEIDLLEMPTNALDELERSDRVEGLLRKLRRLGDLRDESGRLKTGNDLLLAERMKEYQERSKELYDTVEIPGAFQSALSNYEQKLIEEGKQRGSSPFNTLRQQWLDKNTRTVVKQEFYEARQEIIERIKVLQSYLPENQRIQIDITEAWEEILSITKGYRDQDGQPVGSEMTPERVARVKELLKRVDDAREQLRTLSGLTKDEEAELQELFVRAMESSPTTADRARIQALLERKSELRLNRFQRAELTRLFTELSELQKREATDYYVDTMNSWLSTLDTEKLFSAYKINAITRNTANLILEDNLLQEFFDQSPEFEKWFKANHVRRDVYDKMTMEMGERWERIYVWNVVRPQDDAYYETTVVENEDGTKERIQGLPSLKYYKRLVKDHFKTERIVGVTIDNRGNWLPKTMEGGAKDDRYRNQAYYNLQKNNPDLFAVLEKMKEYHLRYQEGLHDSAKLWLDMPRFRKQSIERLQSKNLLQRLIQRIRDFFTRVKDSYQEGLNPVEGEFSVPNWDLFDAEYTGIPMAGVSNLEFQEVSTDIAFTMVRYMLAAERNKKLTEISPVVRAIQRTTKENNPLEKGLKIRNIFKLATGRDRYMREQAVNSFIQREFEGQNQAGFLSDNAFAQNLSSSLFRTASFSYLALNIPSAIKNAVGQKYQSLIEAAAGKYMTTQELLAAEGKATTTMFEITKQVYEPGSKSLNVQLAQLMDFEQGKLESQLGEGLTRTVGKDTMKVVERMTDFRRWTQLQANLQTGFALMSHIKVPVGDKLVAYDQVWEVKEGRLQLKEGVPPEWGITYDAEGNQKVGERYKQERKKIHNIISNLNGAMSRSESSEADRYLLFRYISFFRKFFVAMFANRFARNRVNYQLMDTKEGYYITMLNLTKKVLTSAGKYLPYASKDEKRALIRFTTELGTLVLMSALLPLLFDWDSDDKDRYAKLRAKKGFGGWLSNHTLLLMMQIRGEGEQFIPAPGFGLNQYEEYLGAKSLVTGPTISSMIRVINDLKYAATGDDRLYYKKDVGELPWQKKDEAKIYNHLLKIVGVTGASMSPEIAIKNYEALQVRGR